jgi:hypothetical protein
MISEVSNRFVEHSVYADNLRKASLKQKLNQTLFQQTSISERLEAMRVLGYKREKQLERISVNAARHQKRDDQISMQIC